MNAHPTDRTTYVLVVEDDRDDFFLTQDLLRSVEGQAYHVAWSGSYESARQQLREQHFDVALVDYRIAERTGLEFISQVGPLYPNCPMILLTGLRDPDIDLAAQEAGAADYLVKDSLTEELLDRSIRYACQHAQRWSLLNSVLGNALAGMIALDGAGAPIVWNRQALRALELPEDTVGMTSGVVAAALSRLSDAGRMSEEFTNGHGNTFEISVGAVPGGGQVVAFHDITKRQQAEQLLRQAVADAEAANRAKSSFLATMSHELRTPLNGILGMVRVLERTAVDDAQLSYIDTIKTSGESLLGLINDVLDLSKIEAGRLEIEDIEYEPTPLVEDVVKLLAPSAAAKGLEISAFIDPTIARLASGDPLRVKQVLTNLVGNAVKFTGEGSVVISALPKTQRGKLWLEFHVADTGIGIPEEKVSQLFRKFTQVDASTTRKYGGTGLGLALCKELVSLMGGTISCRSEAGIGSTFAFRVPAGDVNPTTEAITRRLSQSLNGSRILTVTPNPAVADVLHAYAAACGGEVVAAATMAEALAAHELTPCSCMIFDSLACGSAPEALLLRLRADKSRAAPLTVLLDSDTPEGRDLADMFDEQMSRPILRSGFERLRKRLSENAAPPSARPAARKALRPDGKQLRILMAEDNEPNQRVATAMLATAGYTIDLVADGLMATARVESNVYDVILMDVNMPQLDGLEATRRIREMPNGRDVPVIGLTANAMRDDRQQCIDAGMTDHMAKPIDWDKLIALLDALEREVVARVA